MRFRTFGLILIFVVMAAMAVYLVLSSSYQRSLQSKVYYHLGEYAKAYKIAKEAHDENRYNRMAATVMTQSRLALEYEDYIHEGKDFLEKIKELSHHQTLQRADKIRIKFMAEVMIERYPKLTPTVVIDSVLKTQAKKLFLEFQTIHATVSNAL